MQINEAAIDFIKSHEGLRLEAYPDPAHGWSVPTIGYGHTAAAGAPNVMKGMIITKAQAEDILRHDLRAFEAVVSLLVKVPINANQFGALVSFTFNLGASNLKSSTLLKKLNAGDYLGASDEFPRWNKAGGKVVAGLSKRRAAERELFLTPVLQSGWIAALMTLIGTIFRRSK